MQIKIAERLRPYSTLPGTYFVLPRSALRLQIFPAKIDVVMFVAGGVTPCASIAMDVRGPVDDFTIQQDLERGCVVVWGRSKTGYFRYRIGAAENGLEMVFEKAPERGIAVLCEGEWTHQTQDGSRHVFGTAGRLPLALSVDVERLSLGSHKAQDWTLIRKRIDFTEIFPLWHRLGQMVPQQGDVFLTDFQDRILRAAPENVLSVFKELFLVGFDFALSPRLADDDFQGIHWTGQSGYPLQVLTEGAQLIRSLFVCSKDDNIRLLPHCPPEFHCGRLLHVECDGGTLDLEWTKKAVRRAVFMAKESRTLSFAFSHGKQRCRVRTGHADRGVEYQAGSPLPVSSGTAYWFDQYV